LSAGFQSRAAKFSDCARPLGAGAGSRSRDSFWRKSDAFPKARGASTIAGIASSRTCFARESTKLPRLRRSRPSYSLTSARAIFWEMYPSTAPMINEITMLMNGFSSDAVVTAPSLLPASASHAGMSLSVGALAAYTRIKTVIKTHIPAQSGTPSAPPSGTWVTRSSAM
jgi:hypothetical protein